MLNPVFKSPKHLVAEWPEVFEDLYITSFPVGYVETILIEFSDGGLWEIDLTLHQFNIDIDGIVETIKDYKGNISNFKVNINMAKLKLDVTQQTKNLF
jgi:hypothetical protein